jgi:hypothetical protein
VHPKVVSEMLGHASVSITLDLYGYVLPDMQRDAMEVMARLFEGVTDKRSRPFPNQAKCRRLHHMRLRMNPKLPASTQSSGNLTAIACFGQVRIAYDERFPLDLRHTQATSQALSIRLDLRAALNDSVTAARTPW